MVFTSIALCNCELIALMVFPAVAYNSIHESNNEACFRTASCRTVNPCKEKITTNAIRRKSYEQFRYSFFSVFFFFFYLQWCYESRITQYCVVVRKTSEALHEPEVRSDLSCCECSIVKRTSVTLSLHSNSPIYYNF